MLRNKWVAWLVLLMIVVVVGGCGKDKEEDTASKKVVATYDGGSVTEGQFEKYLHTTAFMNPDYIQMLEVPEFQESLIRQKIAFDLLFDKLDDQQKSDAEKTAKDQIKQFMDSVEEQGQMADVETAMKQLEVNDDDLIDYLRINIGVAKDQSTKATDAQIKTQFEKNIHDFDIVTVRHILIMSTDPATAMETRTMEEALKLATEVRQKLKDGGDFAALALQYSDDEGSKENGGLYEDQQASAWVAGFKEAATTLPIGEISEPVETEFGYHIVKVEKRASKTFDEIEAGAKEELRQKAGQARVTEFMSTELEKLIEKIELPTVPAKDGAAGTGNDNTGDTGTDDAGTNNAETDNAGTGDADQPADETNK